MISFFLWAPFLWQKLPFIHFNCVSAVLRRALISLINICELHRCLVSSSLFHPTCKHVCFYQRVRCKRAPEEAGGAEIGCTHTKCSYRWQAPIVVWRQAEVSPCQRGWCQRCTYNLQGSEETNKHKSDDLFTKPRDGIVLLPVVTMVSQCGNSAILSTVHGHLRYIVIFYNWKGKNAHKQAKSRNYMFIPITFLILILIKDS